MAKKKSKNNTNVFLALGAAVLLLISVISIFLNCVEVPILFGIKTEVSALQIAFGYTSNGHIEVKLLSFSFMGFVIILLVVVALALAILSVLKPKQKLFPLIGVIAAIAAGVMFFFIDRFAMFALTDEMMDIGSITVGAYLGGITAILGGICLAGSVIKK